ncbi:ABC-F family ATP-binding cassette domain-containing protein [Pontibacter sp. G13]|uniref:ABC-F family ATP-binding cassette domain-containing protein n=1 Tax=Pontibacter sp. G13 TaxID=3074898 RepID=UPI00288A3F94|nr:ABC-F family ATP-binding cassette domain-containing protein [Pontibacter sp. G13]WNJ16260.1 ABC-F family ATP-binding cassette domain-containing protein [Pontibacter sp. G13]
MNYLSAENISKGFGMKTLFQDISFGIDQGQKIALIGVNGSGKSSLLKILAGVEQPDKGNVTYRNGIRVAYLPQEPDLPLHKTVSEVVFSADLPAVKLIAKYEALLLKSGDDPKAQAELVDVMSEIDAQEAWDYEVKIKQILSKLDVGFLDRTISELSGGQKKRVAMAQALIGEPDLMIMDEPTNHLDLESIEWLEKFLSTSKQSLLLVTHDRYFLDGITTEIVELNRGELFSYKGNYAYFLEKRAEREMNRMAETEKAKSLYKRELEWLRRSPKARTTKSKSRIDAAGDLKQKASYKQQNDEATLMVKGRRIGSQVLEIKHLNKSYGEKVLLDGFTYTFNRKDRIGIIGPNGVGKSTFLRMIVGEEQADSGKIRTGETIVYGYYRQDGLNFKDNARVIEVVTEAAEEVEMSKNQKVPASKLLEHFLFPRSMHYNLVETLSGGEKRRLHLLRVLMTNPNFLILDEPTNDLDLITLRKLEEFLAEFDGCLVVVSHDRFFMDRLVDHLFVFQGDGTIKDFPGSYSQYREWADKAAADVEKAKSDAAKQKSGKSNPESAPKANSGSRKGKLSYKEKMEFEKLEAEIPKLEEKRTGLSAQINSGGSDYEMLDKLSKELEALDEEIEEKSFRWMELTEILEGNG